MQERSAVLITVDLCRFGYHVLPNTHAATIAVVSVGGAMVKDATCINYSTRIRKERIEGGDGLTRAMPLGTVDHYVYSFSYYFIPFRVFQWFTSSVANAVNKYSGFIVGTFEDDHRRGVAKRGTARLTGRRR